MNEATRGRKKENTSGVSEIIGAILLISLVVLAAAIVGMFLLSQQTPTAVPNVNFMVGTDNRIPPTLYLYHNGGDGLRNGEFSVVVDGDVKPYTITGGDDFWSLGDNLIVPLSTAPRNVQIIYNATGGGGVLLRSASVTSSTASTDILPDFIRPTPSAICLNGSDPQQIVSLVLNNVSLIGDAINQSPQTVGPVIASSVGTNSISFFKDDKVNLDYTGTRYLKIIITKPGSSILATDFHATNPVILYPGDIVTITLRPNTGVFKTFGLGDQLWEISATGVDVNITQGGVPDARTNGDVIHAWITGYTDLGSTLTITSDNPYTSNTVLVVNGTQRINGASSENVVISNIQPVGIGLFLLEGDNNAHIVYFVGNAQSVTRNGVPVV